MDAVQPSGAFARHFLARYRRSLSDYRLFYDDLAETGSPDQADHAFYYVPGISGSPGQIRIALPSLMRVFGPRIYIRGLAAPEFSVEAPIWEKYTRENTERKLTRLRQDLVALSERFGCFTVVCSSNGMYDFLAAAATFPADELESRVHLVWVSCAPDQFERSSWERVFFPLNGVTYQGYRWFAYPNHGVLQGINPETACSFDWREGHQQRRFHKVDIESRFRCAGLHWDYVSTSQLGDIARYVVAQIDRPWNAPAEALIAANDGYWQGKTREGVEAVVRRYVPQARCTVRPGSHVGVINPTNLTELLGHVLPTVQSRQPFGRISSVKRASVARRERSMSV